MAPSLVAIAFYRTEEAAQVALEALARKGYLIKQLVTPPAAPLANAAPRGWGAAHAPVSVGLFVSHTPPSVEANHKDAPALQTTLPVDQAATGREHGHIAIIYSEVKEEAIQTLASKEPMQMYRY